MVSLLAGGSSPSSVASGPSISTSVISRLSLNVVAWMLCGWSKFLLKPPLEGRLKGAKGGLKGLKRGLQGLQGLEGEEHCASASPADGTTCNNAKNEQGRVTPPAGVFYSVVRRI